MHTTVIPDIFFLLIVAFVLLFVVVGVGKALQEDDCTTIVVECEIDYKDKRD